MYAIPVASPSFHFSSVYLSAAWPTTNLSVFVISVPVANCCRYMYVQLYRY